MVHSTTHRNQRCGPPPAHAAFSDFNFNFNFNFKYLGSEGAVVDAINMNGLSPFAMCVQRGCIAGAKVCDRERAREERDRDPQRECARVCVCV
jgi:hypothetical protein